MMKENKDIIRLVISDLHIGSLHSKEEKLYKFLSEMEFDELILAGDIIDFIKVPRFTEYSVKLFDLISSLKKPVIYIVGNHDVALEKMINKKISNIQFLKEYNFDYCGRKYRIQHGDQYDTGIVHWRFFMSVVSIFQDFFERYLRFNLGAWWINLQKKKNELKRIWDITQWNENADVFIMGHTHNPEAVIWVDKNQIIKTYINTGDWVQHSTYVIIKEGQVRLKDYRD